MQVRGGSTAPAKCDASNAFLMVEARGWEMSVKADYNVNTGRQSDDVRNSAKRLLGFRSVDRAPMKIRAEVSCERRW